MFEEEKVKNIAKVQEFSERDDEDLVEWIRKFVKEHVITQWF